MNTLQILLGSNWKQEKHMAEARERLKRAFHQDILFSENLKNAAMDLEGLEKVGAVAYLNAIGKAHTELPLEKVQLLLKEIETEMGRKRGLESKGMVTIDLDLIEWNGVILRPKDAAQMYYKDCLKSLIPE